jgi:hypothetical protein
VLKRNLRTRVLGFDGQPPTYCLFDLAMWKPAGFELENERQTGAASSLTIIRARPFQSSVNRMLWVGGTKLLGAVKNG